MNEKFETLAQALTDIFMENSELVIKILKDGNGSLNFGDAP